MKKKSVKTPRNNINLSLLFLAALLPLTGGCHQEKVQVYQVASEQDQPAQPVAPPATNASDANSALPPGHPDVPSMGSSQMPAGVVASDVQNASPLTWTTPTGWISVPPSEMRAASFKIAGANGAQADVSVVPLPGIAGGDAPNVNRWRGQVGLPAASDADLQASAENVEAGDQSALLYDIAGQNPASGESNRILGAIQHRDGTTWFFKMTGGADLIEQQKAAFIAFLKSLNFEPQPAQASLTPGHPDMSGAGNQQSLPPGHPDIGGMAAPSGGPVSNQGQPNWQAPADWQPVSAGGFLVAKFAISGANGAAAAVNVSTSQGNGGGLASNVNRWRGQLGLPPADEISTVTFSVANGQAQLVDLSGTNAKSGQPAELLGIVVTQPGQTWFYKLMGDPGVVAVQKDAFTQFVKGVKY